MNKALCPKCKKVIILKDNNPMIECPHCGQQILTEGAVKDFYKTVQMLSKRGELAINGYSDYQRGYEYYRLLHALVEEDLNGLMWVVLARIYCSTYHKIYVKDATDILLKDSEKVEINKENVFALADSLNKFKTEIEFLVSKFNEYKGESEYTLKQYHNALNEYRYFLEVYLKINDALGELNKYLKDSKDIINEDIKKIDESLKEKVNVKSNSVEMHQIKDKDDKVIDNIFPDKKKLFILRMSMYGIMGIGAILSIVGLILMATQASALARGLVLGIGLAMFIGGYFVGHKLKSIHYNLKY